MRIDHAIFSAFVAAFVITLVINFWINKLGGAISCLGSIVIFLFSAVAVLLFLMFAPDNLFTIAAITGLAIVVLTLIIHLISQS